MTQFKETWTDAEVEQLSALWLSGKTGTQIGVEMDRPRSAVLGKIHRLRRQGVSLARPMHDKAINLRRDNNRREIEARRQARAAKLAAKTPRPNNFARVNIGRKTTTRGNEPIPTPEIIDITLAKPWLERRFGECAAPVAGEGADTLSCCHPCGAHTYCAHHRARFYQPPSLTKAARDKSVSHYASRRAA